MPTRASQSNLMVSGFSDGRIHRSFHRKDEAVAQPVHLAISDHENLLACISFGWPPGRSAAKVRYGREKHEDYHQKDQYLFDLFSF